MHSEYSKTRRPDSVDSGVHFGSVESESAFPLSPASSTFSFFSTGSRSSSLTKSSSSHFCSPMEITPPLALQYQSQPTSPVHPSFQDGILVTPPRRSASLRSERHNRYAVHISKDATRERISDLLSKLDQHQNYLNRSSLAAPLEEQFKSQLQIGSPPNCDSKALPPLPNLEPDVNAEFLTFDTTGYLQIAKRTMGLTSWKSRYFILSDRILSYYKDDDMMADCYGTFELSPNTIVRVTDDYKNKKWVIEVKDSGQCWHLQASSSRNLSRWLKALKDAVQYTVNMKIADEFGPSHQEVHAEKAESVYSTSTYRSYTTEQVLTKDGLYRYL
ncbi:hypothetical protein BKA69DRAFT_1082405 [Paraphysoderma sedebokerense]|nr:hypothetical protein BKA69DRAFT_1082350 [Paraphysoderma sedebokerense]KAI9140047.1 hypothetical protein BKA69DRAFT_1082405 [Paraphysoderma sedebokerense]